ncbi:MAG: hypothetical protein PHD15_05970 [Clostridia bacterium]|nr:hypothetical protein [Clostridia bacterium]MDD4387278.1 hypothetical protein [Clostridia bacterium]
MDINGFEEIKKDFVKRFTKRYDRKYKEQIEEKLNKVEIMKLPPKAGAAASYRSYTLHDYGINTDTEGQIIVDHELNHAVSGSSKFGRYNYKTGEMDTRNENESYSNISQEYYDFISKDQDLEKVLVMESGYFESRCFCEFLNEYINIGMNSDRLSKGSMVYKDGSYVTNDFFGSYYDSGLNLFGTLSSIIGEDKIVDLHLGHITLSEIMKDFDEKYSDSLDKNEIKKFNTPMIKLLYNMNNVYENLDSKEYESALNTLHKAYEIKLSNLDIKKIEDVEKTYNEIKNMQNMMLFSVPQEKMENEEYIKSIERIEENFIQKVNCLKLNISTQQFIDNISYKNVIPISIDDSKRLSKMIIASNNNANIEEQFNDYTLSVDETKDKKNGLYRSLFNAYQLVKDSLYNHCDEMQGMLKNIEKLDSIKSEEEYINLYSTLYEQINEKAKTNMHNFMSAENLKSEFSIERFKNIKSQIEIIKKSAYVDKNGLCLGYDSEIEKSFNLKLEYYKNYSQSILRNFIESVDKSNVAYIKRLEIFFKENQEKFNKMPFEDIDIKNKFLESLKNDVYSSKEIVESKRNYDNKQVVKKEHSDK